MPHPWLVYHNLSITVLQASLIFHVMACGRAAAHIHNNAVTQPFLSNVAVRIAGPECKVETTVVAYSAFRGFEVHCTLLIEIAEGHARKSRKTYLCK